MGEFKIGDVVELISRIGVRMTVAKVNDDSIECVWFDNDIHLNRAWFYDDVLRMVKVDR